MSLLLEFLHESQEISGLHFQSSVELTVFVKFCGYMKHSLYSNLSLTYFLDLFLIKTPPLQVYLRTES